MNRDFSIFIQSINFKLNSNQKLVFKIGFSTMTLQNCRSASAAADAAPQSPPLASSLAVDNDAPVIPGKRPFNL
jgi:hypothetical protein